MADLTNLGYNNVPNSAGNNVQNTGQVMWDPMWQTYKPPTVPQGTQPFLTGGGLAPLSSYAVQGNGGLVGGQGQAQAGVGQGNQTGNSIEGWIQQQMAQNAQARAQNQANWVDASNAEKALPAQYASDPNNVASNALVQRQLANPDVLSQSVQDQMNTQSAQGLMGAQANANRQQQGIMAAGGQLDASSMAAAAQANSRNAMGAQTNAAQNLAIQAATANNTSRNQAAQLGMGQAAQNIGVAQNSANNIISHLPQYKPDDYTGLITLANGQQQQAFQNNILLQGLQNQQAMQTAQANRIPNPSASGNFLGTGYNATRTGSNVGNDNSKLGNPLSGIMMSSN